MFDIELREALPLAAAEKGIKKLNIFEDLHKNI
jgi:hypothetical protein